MHICPYAADEENEPVPFACWPCAIDHAEHPDDLRDIGRALVAEFVAAHRVAWDAGVHIPE